MNIKRLLLPLITIILVFFSFSALHPLAKLLPTKEHIDYTLDTKGMNNHHRPPLFYLQEDGIFFVHPAREVNATGTFTFTSNKKLFFHFSIQKGSPVGNMLFVLKRNDNFLQQFLVNTKQDATFKTKVHKGDTITVTADPLGATSGDWGNLELKQYEPHYIFKLRIIPFLWAIFFIYLVGKGHFYIALNSYIGFLLTIVAEKVTFGALSFYDTIGYTVLFFFFAFIFTFIYQELKLLKKFKIATLISWIATILVYFIPIAFIVFATVFGKPINWNILFAIYQTNPNEAIEYLKSFIPIQYLIATLAITLFIGYLLWRQELKERKTIERSLLLFIIIFLGSILATNILKVRIPHLIYDTYMQYNADLNRLKEFQKQQKAANIDFNATKKEQGETYVVIIGESQNKYYSGLYGYFRNTSPNLKKQVQQNSLEIFKNAYSCAGSTMRVLSLALTEANQYNSKKYFNSPSIIDIFNKANFDTYWIARQGVDSPNVVSIVAHEAKDILDLVNGYNPDSNKSIIEDARVIKPFTKLISQKTQKNRLIIIHIYGNHFHYQDRYPKSFEKFKPAMPYLVGTNKKDTLYDYSAYDNSILFNDYVINQVLIQLQKQDDISAFLYFSDHGEDQVRHLGHTSRINSFTYEMAQIPMIAWLSPKYKERYPQTAKTLLEHNNTLFSNDMIYDTVIGLAHIKTDHYNPIYDLSSPKYQLDPNKAYTLHRRRLYTSPDNYIYWREHNAKLLKGKSFYSKLVANNTDSVGKLNEAWRLGFRAFKLNLYYMADKKSFQTGTDKYDTGGNLIDTLSYFNTQEINTLVLHLANLNSNNVNEILKRLNMLDGKLKIKNKAILAIENSSLLGLFKKSGWRIASSSKGNFILSDAKSFEKDKTNNPNANFVINHAFNLANAKLEKKLNSLAFTNDLQAKYLLVDLSSVYKW